MKSWFRQIMFATLIMEVLCMSACQSVTGSSSKAAKTAGRLEGWAFREKITIAGNRLAGELREFPALIAITGANLKPVAQGGHVAQANGNDLVFTAADGKTRLAYELERYDAAAGALKAWVNIPVLSPKSDATIYLYYGNPSCASQQQPAQVWSKEDALVLHGAVSGGACPDSTANRNRGAIKGKVTADPAGGYALDGQNGWIEIPSAASLNPGKALTVSAWVRNDGPSAEAFQTAVAQWAPTEALGAFAAYDAGQTDGLDSKGFLGAVFDGRYVYFSPQANSTKLPNGQRRHGIALRYDTHGDFKTPANWQAYDADKTDGLATRGFYGAVFDGRYIYYVPRFDGYDYHSRVLRYDTQGAFTDGKSWSAYDAGIKHSYQSAAFDGRYIYFVPGGPGGENAGKILRFDTRGDFKDKASWTIYRTADLAPGLSTVNFDGAVFDGRYVYFIPLSDSAPIRYDTTQPFTEARSWSAFDAKPLKMKMCVGGIFDGRYIYYVPYAHDVVVRFDIRGEFADAKSWSAFSAGGVPGMRKGFDGAMFDGKYVYFVPFYEENAAAKKQDFHGTVLRYNTTGDFADMKNWSAYDAGNTDGLGSRGYNAGAFDGRFIYFAPWNRGEGEGSVIKGHGVALRYDTLGSNGTFRLNAVDCGHNGGLCAAVPGATFTVNTRAGARSARSNRVLAPGRHYLSGVYDGRAVKLYVDGELVNENAGGGPLIASSVPLAIGRLSNGGGQFQGNIAEIRVAQTARGADWLKTEFENQKAPSAFYKVSAEEFLAGK